MRRFRMGTAAGLAVALMFATAAPAIADSWQDGMLPAPPTGEEAPYFHGPACDINGDGENDPYGQEFVRLQWKADGKVNEDGNWEGKVKFQFRGVVYDYLGGPEVPEDLPDAIVATGKWVLDGEFGVDPSVDLEAFLEGPDPIEAEFDWVMKLTDSAGALIAKTGGTIDLLAGVIDSYGPCTEP